MSLTSLLDKLTSFFSKSFTLAAFVPVLLFAFCNGVLLYPHSRWFHNWVDSQIPKPRVFDLSVATIGLVVAAYTLSSLSTFLRQVLEGKSLLSWWPFVDRRMRAKQQKKLDAIWDKYISARNNNVKLQQDQKLSWQNQMGKAMQAGKRNQGKNELNSAFDIARKTIAALQTLRSAAVAPGFDELNEAVNLLSHALTFSDQLISPLRRDRFVMLYLLDCTLLQSDPDKRAWQMQMGAAAAQGIQNSKGKTNYDPLSNEAAKRISKLRLAKPPLKKSELAKALKLFCAELRANDESVSPLLQDRDTLLKLFDYAARTWGPLEIRYFNERHASFGAGYVAPTLMGNVAESMQNHALSRYGLDLETFWSRLQIVIQTNKEFTSTLQDAKTQLDFLVACCSLSILTWIGWTTSLPFLATKLWIYLPVALGGPLFSYFFYAIATTSYATLADLISSGVDLYRFSLLRALHIPLPEGIRQERALWQTLRSFSSFAQEVELSYNLDQKDPPH